MRDLQATALSIPKTEVTTFSLLISNKTTLKNIEII